MAIDHWQHRSKGMQCQTCMWFVCKAKEGQISEVGRCRKHAPTMIGYPVVYLSDWCGDHKLDSGKLSPPKANMRVMTQAEFNIKYGTKGKPVMNPDGSSCWDSSKGDSQ